MALDGGGYFSNTPLAPPVTKVLIHDKPGQRKSWEPHGVEGEYLVPTMEHYRCYTVYVNKTRAERISDIVEFFPEHNKIPEVSNQEAATNTPLYLIEDISDPEPISLFSSIGAIRLQAISNLEDKFKQTT